MPANESNCLPTDVREWPLSFYAPIFHTKLGFSKHHPLISFTPPLSVARDVPRCMLREKQGVPVMAVIYHGREYMSKKNRHCTTHLFGIPRTSWELRDALVHSRRKEPCLCNALISHSTYMPMCMAGVEVLTNSQVVISTPKPVSSRYCSRCGYAAYWRLLHHNS